MEQKILKSRTYMIKTEEVKPEKLILKANEVKPSNRLTNCQINKERNTNKINKLNSGKINKSILLHNELNKSPLSNILNKNRIKEYDINNEKEKENEEGNSTYEKNLYEIKSPKTITENSSDYKEEIDKGEENKKVQNFEDKNVKKNNIRISTKIMGRKEKENIIKNKKMNNHIEKNKMKISYNTKIKDEEQEEKEEKGLNSERKDRDNNKILRTSNKIIPYIPVNQRNTTTSFFFMNSNNRKSDKGEKLLLTNVKPIKKKTYINSNINKEQTKK